MIIIESIGCVNRSWPVSTLDFVDVSAIGGFRRARARLWLGGRELWSLGGSLTALRAEFGALSPAAIFLFPGSFGSGSRTRLRLETSESG